MTPEAKTRPFSVVYHTAPAAINGERKPPNYAPWDRAQFQERLKSYRHVDKWMGKPEEINEVQWAKRGWSCVGKETVGCAGGCGKEVVITLESSREDKENVNQKTLEREEVDEDEDDWREKAQAQLVEKYAEMIATAHDEGCLWRRRGCDGKPILLIPFDQSRSPLIGLADTIQRLPLAHQGTATGNLRQRYLSLVAMTSELPPNPSIPEILVFSDIHEQILPLLHPPSTKQQTAADTDPSPDLTGSPSESVSSQTLNTSALSLALFGWQAEEGHVSGLATCTACFRRLGLWLFKASSDASTSSSMDRLDVIGEHRDYCPWINALSQNGAASRRTSLDGLAGWQVLLRAVYASKLHKNYDVEMEPAVVPSESDDAASEIGTVASVAVAKEDRKDQDEKDKERWAKLKKLKQVFHVRKGKGRDSIILKKGEAKV